MTRNLLSYEWVCPVCSKRQSGLETRDESSIEAQAVNALLGHVRTVSGGGHGRDGEYPPWFDPDDAHEHVTVSSEVDDPTSDVTG